MVKTSGRRGAAARSSRAIGVRRSFILATIGVAA
jgi:hypothetical protein